ncbi:helix-turn-helix transcriptional regulator [Shewanella sp. 10N.261.52.F9]|uniref:helix-turn-helix transcriptional regulator n=1 Tax=Shewanella sp. 10N.261.52.F9 TaxID=3229684 RepID=UPI003553C7ED
MENELFAHFVRDYRKRNNLTQNRLVQIVTSASDEFYGLDTVTISRWENNVTSPQLYRKLKVADILGVDWYSHTLDKLDLNNDKHIENDDIFSTIKEKIPLMINIDEASFINISDLSELKGKAIWQSINEFIFKLKEDYFINLDSSVTTSLYLSNTGLTGYYSVCLMCNRDFWQYLGESNHLLPLVSNCKNDECKDSLIIGGYYGLTKSVSIICLATMINEIVNLNVKRVAIICKSKQQKVIAENLGFKEYKTKSECNLGKFLSIMYAEVDLLKSSGLFYQLFIKKQFL